MCIRPFKHLSRGEVGLYMRGGTEHSGGVHERTRRLQTRGAKREPIHEGERGYNGFFFTSESDLLSL